MKILTKEQFEKLYGTTTANQFKTVKPSGETEGLVDRVKGTVKKAGSEISDLITGQGNPIVRGTQAAATAARGVGQVGADIAGVVPGVTKGLEMIGNVVGKGFNATTEGLSETLPFRMAANNLKQGGATEQVLQTASALGEVAALPLAGAGLAKTATLGMKGLAATPKALATVAEATGKGIKQIPNAIAKTGNVLVDSLATENPVKLAKIKTGVANNLNDYAQEFSKSRNAIAGATNKIDGFDYGKHVAERNLLPDVTDSGRFDGTNIIKGLEAENAGFANTVQTKLNASTRTTPVESLRQALLEDVTSKANIGDADSIRTYVDKYINEVRNRYGDNLTDKQIYDIKVDADGGYNYTSPNADINASKIIADRARQFIKGDKEIADALDAQSKNFEAIRITKALEPYKVKAGTLSTRLAQLGGAVLGAGATEGGGLLQAGLAATLGGLAGGKMVKAIQQAAFISPAARASIKKELLKATTPETTKAILKNLDNGVVDLPQTHRNILQKIGDAIKNTPNKQGGFIKNPINKKTNPLIERVSDAIKSIDTDPVKVNGKLEFGNVDDAFELDAVKRKLDAGKKISITEAEYYAPILKRNGIDVYKELDTMNKVDVPEDFILKEANKFSNGRDFSERLDNKTYEALREKGIRGQEQREKYWEEITGKKSEKGYAMSHRPSKLGATGDDISKTEAIPSDFYEHPEWYANMRDKTYQESYQALKKMKGKPDMEITIYRAAPKNELNDGDWITLSKAYAKQSSLEEGTPVHSFKVKAKDIQYAGDDINEFGYYPEK